MLKLYSAISALALIAACSASADVPADRVAIADAPAAVAVSETASVAELAGAPAAEPSQRQARAVEREASMPVSCEIRTRRTGNGLLVEAVARADEAMVGDYELVIRASGGGNDSDMTQAGPFEAASGRQVTLGQSEISFGRGARLNATLTLRGEDGQVCRDALRR